AGRGGAGLVTLAVPGLIAPTLAAKSELTSMTWFVLPHDLGALTPDALKVLREKLPGYDALALGMGVGQEEVTQRFIHGLLGLKAAGEHGRAAIGFVRARSDREEGEEQLVLPPTVLDADGLNALAAAEAEWWMHLPPQRLVLTPHPGEMSRLTGRETADIQRHRLDVAREQAEIWGQVVVLKGAHSVIAAPDGRATFSPFATATLATAGTGDVLAGVIAGLLAQGLEPYDAARFGVYLHGLAGALMADTMPVALSSDLPGFLTDAWALLAGA
ncbi:MAG TPA: bifunctional ADP-dependent NAD(P)H-hydrate dehydratase/NAD(P)H-hydrate epimerase, partial [Chloroflexi bacterium]|nr:bifunctional ADP-dependent NAD(P)H-hydrate dehydratase/NAD(P)H-hydrate epimerase [Chloroflexota bacterium]